MKHVHTTYIICSTPRSGSHLLGEALFSTGLAGKPDEYFLPNSDGILQNELGNIADQYGQKSLEEFRDFVFDFACSDNGVAGFTLMGNYFHLILRNYQNLPQYKNLNRFELINALFEKPKFIWLKRRDKVKQSVSWIKARHSGVWGSHMKRTAQSTAQRPLEYDYFLIENQMNRFVEFDGKWAAFFEEYGIKPYVVVYEELVTQVEETTLNILGYLDIEHPDTLQFAQRKLKKQANTLSEEWVSRFKRERVSFIHRIFRFMRYLKFKIIPAGK